MRKLRWLILFLLIMITVSSTVAQQCLSIVNEALDRASSDCRSTGRNEACYGYNNVIALPNVNPNTFNFDEEGDIAPIEQIEVMELSPLSEDDQAWGVVIARVQAQIPDTLPGQNVTIVFFGGVNVQNDGVDTTGVQAFRFESGIGESRCLGLPPDGIIIETPEDSTVLTFDINGVEVTLGSTAFLETFSETGTSDDLMLRVGMFEGIGFISAAGQTTRITDGQQTTIPLDANLEAAGAPTPASEFDTGSLNIMLGFLDGLGFDDNGTTAPLPPAETEEATGIPCTVSTDRDFTAGLRVGPGTNRTQRAWLQRNREVTVTGISDDGQWWQLDKYEAFPSGANSVVELWVNVDVVTTNGDCFLIGNAAAPPIIAPPVGQPNPPADDDDDKPPPAATEDVHEPIVIYHTEEVPPSGRVTSVTPICTNIFWHIEYVSAVYLVGASSQPVALAGITGSYQVCPRVTTTYYIRVVYTNGSQEDFPVVVHRAN